MPTNLDCILHYLSRGWKVVPIPKGSKAPIIPRWQELRLTAEDLPRYFNNGQNVGVLLGEPSGNLTDVDLDCTEALQVAPAFLPHSGAIFGRASKPKSHWLYYCPDAKTTRFEFKGECLVEIRSTGGQTVFPPSVHPSGEVVSWHEEGEPSEVTYERLKRAVAKMASCVLLSRHYPAQGGRQFAAMALAGWLLRNGWSREDVSEFILALAHLAGDSEARMRVTQIKNTEIKVEADLPATGFPKLRGYYPEEVLMKVAEWLTLKTESEKGKQPQIVVVEKFYPRPFSELLMSKYTFWWPGEKEPLYWFDSESGLWREDGQSLVESQLRTSLDALPDVQKKRYVIDEIVADVKGCSWRGKPLPEPDVNLIPCANGVYELNTKKLRNYLADDFFTWKLPWDYNRDALSEVVVPLIESFLPKDETTTLYELMAYCLYRAYPYQKIFILYGRGSNGKSLFARMLEHLLGVENISHTSMKEIQRSGFAASELYHKLANICGELEYNEIEDTRLLKQLCGGDTIQADRKYRNPIHFTNYAKLIFLTNEVPSSRDTTEAFYRRLFLVEFPKKFKENPELEVRLANADAEEYEALLFVAIKQLEKLMEQNFIFTRHKGTEETRELYLKLSSPLQTFIEENCEVTRMQWDYIFKYDFNQRFGEWLQNKGRTAYTEKRVKNEMQKLNFEDGRKGKENYWAWVGLRWKKDGKQVASPSTTSTTSTVL